MPKTYSIHLKKGKLSGFLRFVAEWQKDGKIGYYARVV
jgi:hypothetical protein